jgi:hypothetical protein
MTDEELINRLLSDVQLNEVAEIAANRIKELVKEVAEADARALRYKSERNGQARKISDAQSLDTASFEAEQKIVNQRGEINILQARTETAEAKLAKAMEALRYVVSVKGLTDPIEHGYDAIKFARAVLAKLEKTE